MCVCVPLRSEVGVLVLVSLTKCVYPTREFCREPEVEPGPRTTPVPGQRRPTSSKHGGDSAERGAVMMPRRGRQLLQHGLFHQSTTSGTMLSHGFGCRLHLLPVLLHVCACASVHVCACVRACVLVCVDMCVCAHAHVHVYLRVNGVCVVCVCVCVSIYDCFFFFRRKDV